MMKHLLFLDAVKPAEIILILFLLTGVIGLPALIYKWGFKNGYYKGRYDETKKGFNNKH